MIARGSLENCIRSATWSENGIPARTAKEAQAGAGLTMVAADKIRDEGPRHDGPTNAFLLEANARPTSLLTLSPPSFRQRVEIVATRFRS